jgi:predicted aldo/keto reductase-like oxidoreductase
MAIEFGKRFGLGGLRLPVLDPNEQRSIDYETLEKMIDIFMEHGFTYYDTSYIYHGGLSEAALGKTLVDRYPRDSFLLSTKMPIKFMKEKEDMERIFEEQLKRCHVDYFDFYLIHAISKEGYENCKKWGAFEFLKQKRAEGKFREFGVSLHDSPEFLDLILTEHPEIDFVVEQLNYIDWENPAIRAREIYEVAVKHGKPVVVMEACKGGTLAEIPDEAKRLMKTYNPDASIASWAYRFVGSLPGVRVVLAGMPRMDFLLDNIKTFENFVPLNVEEYKIIDQVVGIINSTIAIPCTVCRYCESECPKDIAIPDYFALYNDMKRLEKSSSQNDVLTQALYYGNLIEQRGPASACIECESCKKVCPQHLDIPKYLKEYIVAELESFSPEEHIKK